MKTIYFVRHGESETNAGSVQLGTDSALTEKGEKQARFIAKRCADIPHDVLVSSTLKRAKDTAGFISEAIGATVEYSDLFVERRRPSEQIGLNKSESRWQEIEKNCRDNFAVSGYHYSDEENFEDLRDRAGAAWKYLEERDEENIIVVTHGMFLRIMAACAVIGFDVPVEIGEQFINKFHHANTGLTVFKYDESSRKTPWWLWVWNDHAHFAGLEK